MRAIVYPEPRRFDLVEVPTPEPGPGEVLVRLSMTGLCGTDLHLHQGQFGPRYPLTPGHEMVGEVTGLGDGVADLRVGQRVCIDNAVGCTTCPEC